MTVEEVTLCMFGSVYVCLRMSTDRWEPRLCQKAGIDCGIALERVSTGWLDIDEEILRNRFDDRLSWLLQDVYYCVDCYSTDESPSGILMNKMFVSVDIRPPWCSTE